MHTGNGFSFAFSLFIHFAILLGLLSLKFDPPLPAGELIEIGFGGGYGDGGGGTEFVAPQPAAEENTAENSVPDKTKLPESKEPADDAVSKTKTDKNKDGDGAAGGNSNTKGIGPGDGPGNGGDGTGFFFDWGGGGRRKIYHYVIPEYPSGVNKEIDIRLRFTILPDGSVGTILPLAKADARLENSAVNSLRQWRFEPLPKSMAQIEQVAVITFPFRLQ